MSEKLSQAASCRNTLKSEAGSLCFSWHQRPWEYKDEINSKATLHASFHREASPQMHFYNVTNEREECWL